MPIFEAAQCVKCGASLDVAHMRCKACGTNATINWHTAVTTVSRKPHASDQIVELLILAAVQTVAAENGVEVCPAVAGDASSSSLTLMVKDTVNGEWLDGGSVSCSVGRNRTYYELYAGTRTYRTSWSLSWQELLEGDGRFYAFEPGGGVHPTVTLQG